MTAYYAEPRAAWYSEPGVDLYQGDTRAVMAGLPAESVDCVVFSPPFLGLRVYDGVQSVPWADGQNCAWGLEPSVELWVAHTVEVMQAVKRVLKPSGVCWVEVGDSYAGSGSPGGDFRNGKGGDDYLRPYGHGGSGLKPKDLCLVPERLALALQADGWWVRSRIVWAKSNPMPESVSDRPTKSHSVIWMLTKAERYFWDQEAVREIALPASYERMNYPKNYNKAWLREGTPISGGKTVNIQMSPSGRNLRDVWEFPTSPFGYEMCQSCGQIYTAAQFGRLPVVHHGRHHAELVSGASTQEARELNQKTCRCGASDFLSHFATFPEALPTRCILASTSEAGCCPKCGRPWERKIEHKPSTSRQNPGYLVHSGRQDGGGKRHGSFMDAQSQTLGWAATCKCDLPQAENVPATVLDVCSGSGTSVLAAKKLGRRAVGIDLSEKYLALARRRLSEVPMSLGKGVNT